MATERLTERERFRLAAELPADMNEIDRAIALDELAEHWLDAEAEMMARGQ
jgi:hypothetical protein